MSAVAIPKQFHTLDVVGLRRDTRDAIVVTLAPAVAERHEFEFLPGQYLTFEQRIDGEAVRRTYSICAAPFENRLQVAIKRVVDGVFSSWANDELKLGDTLKVMPPLGEFHRPRNALGEAHIFCVACGSGITPIISIIKATLGASPRSKVTLLYGNRSSNSIMFREELEALKDNNLERVNIVHVLSREAQEIDLFNGRLNEAKFNALFKHWIDPVTMDEAYLCGPMDVMAAARASLRAQGMEEAAIHQEFFVTENRDAKRKRRQTKAAAGVAATVRATVVLHGSERSFDMPAAGKSVLESALAEGMDVPYSCQGGACSTCRAMLVEGEVEMDTNYVLEDYEVRRGYVLTCQSYPLTTSIKVDYDLP